MQLVQNGYDEELCGLKEELRIKSEELRLKNEADNVTINS